MLEAGDGEDHDGDQHARRGGGQAADFRAAAIPTCRPNLGQFSRMRPDVGEQRWAPSVSGADGAAARRARPLVRQCRAGPAGDAAGMRIRQPPWFAEIAEPGAADSVSWGTR